MESLGCLLQEGNRINSSQFYESDLVAVRGGAIRMNLVPLVQGQLDLLPVSLCRGQGFRLRALALSPMAIFLFAGHPLQIRRTTLQSPAIPLDFSQWAAIPPLSLCALFPTLRALNFDLSTDPIESIKWSALVFLLSS